MSGYKMRQEMITIAFAAVMLLLLIWRIKSGYACGMMQEIVNILSGTAALACVALILFAVTSAMSKSMHILTASVVGLILLGVVFKLCSLIFKPLLAVDNIFVLSGINKVLGAALGILEVVLLAYVSYRVLDFLGIYVF